MAFNRQIFKTRTLTAVVFVVVMLAGLLWNRWSFFILFSVIHFGCWVEFQKMTGRINQGYKKINLLHQYGIMLAGWCLLLYFAGDAYVVFGVRLHVIGEWAGPVFLFAVLVESLLSGNAGLKNLGLSTLGLIYISLSLGLIVNLFDFPLTRTSQAKADIVQIIPPIIIFTLWINDTMAYIIGSLMGKTTLSSISPKKTWEGTIGGFVLAVAVIGLILTSNVFSLAAPAYHWFLIPAIVSIAGTFGDLLESKLKRSAGVKDSGSIMPGHGGFLDRFDSLLLAIPFAWLYVQFFLK